MSLTLYKKKRSFKKTPEPAGKKRSQSKSKLRFVVQKHDATQLHYDFRLEMEGVLKSWAVPKGPSLNPDDKRLAMMVEDHPYDYRTFEGTIPEGNYGAGTVMVWDEGIYEAMGYDQESTKDQEKILLTELKKGDVKIVLHGEKLKGTFGLVKMHKGVSSGKDHGENAWLLIKKKDDEASDIDITKKDKSVKTKRSLTQIAKDSGGTVKTKTPQRKTKLAPQLLGESEEDSVKKKPRK
jgi:bifunctional non-homologous end joining protein LigD